MVSVCISDQGRLKTGLGVPCVPHILVPIDRLRFLPWMNFNEMINVREELIRVHIPQNGGRSHDLITIAESLNYET